MGKRGALQAAALSAVAPCLPRSRPQWRLCCGRSCLCLWLCWRRCSSGMLASSCFLRWYASFFIASMAGALHPGAEGRTLAVRQSGDAAQARWVHGARVRPLVWPVSVGC